MICTTCGVREATCVGRYEDMDTCEPSCDECCGHGCEDGHCDRVEVDPSGDWECSCGEEGDMEAQAELHLKRHMNETNVGIARQELEEA